MAIGAIVSGGLNLLGAGVNAIGAAKQARQMRKLSESQLREGRTLDAQAEASRPIYDTPQEIMARLNQARSAESGTSTTQAELERQAARAEASDVSGISRYATSGAQGLAALSALGDRRYDAVSRAVVTGAAERQMASQRADQLGSAVSEFRDQEFEINELAPFIEKKIRAQELRSAGMTNQLTAIGAKANVWSSIGEGLSNLSGPAGSIAESIFGKKKTQN
jgi:hypothetical protein